MADDNRFLSIPEAAARLGVSRIAVFKKVKNGRIAAIRIGRNWAVPASALEAPAPGASGPIRAASAAPRPPAVAKAAPPPPPTVKTPKTAKTSPPPPAAEKKTFAAGKDTLEDIGWD